MASHYEVTDQDVRTIWHQVGLDMITTLREVRAVLETQSNLLVGKVGGLADQPTNQNGTITVSVGDLRRVLDFLHSARMPQSADMARNRLRVQVGQ